MIEFVKVEGACVGVEIVLFYVRMGESSIVLRSKSRSVFLNGFMHMVEYSTIVSVDMEGETWMTIHKPGGAEISIHQAHGHLCVCCADFHNRS
jgi:archaellum component FlaG (FlaF/FlaG flagellin family)